MTCTSSQLAHYIIPAGAAFHYVTFSILLWTLVHSFFICLKVVFPIFMKRTEKSYKYIHFVISVTGTKLLVHSTGHVQYVDKIFTSLVNLSRQLIT